MRFDFCARSGGGRRARHLHRLATVLLSVAGLLSLAVPASARILKTKRPGEYREFVLTVGSGLEFETDADESVYDFPFLVEYGVTEELRLAAEPNYVWIRGNDGDSVDGFGDLETSATYELIGEEEQRPSFSAEFVIKWPTASKDELGTGEPDYSLGAIVSKEFERFDLDFETLYTFVGDPPGVDLQNSLELGLAAEWPLNDVFSLLGELVSSSGGGFRGQAGSIGGIGGTAGSNAASEEGGREVAGTLGLSILLAERLKLEQGVILVSDGSWQAVFSWEWNFGEGQ